MERKIEDLFDKCISRIEAGEDLKEILSEYPEQAAEITPLLEIVQEMYLLSPLQESMAAALAEQKNMKNLLSECQDPRVFSSKKPFWENWAEMLAQITHTISSKLPKENMMYRKSFIAIALVFVFLLFGTTITAFAAQESLPGDVLYGVKVKLEDLQVNTTWDTANEVEKSIQYADLRIQEIAELENRSRQTDIPIGVERFEYHLREAVSALDAIAKDDPDQAQELALILTNLLEEHSKLIAALLESDSGANVMVLSEALVATYLSMDTVGSIAGITERDAVNSLNSEAGMNDDIISNGDDDAMDDDDYGYDDDNDDAMDDDDYGYDDDNDDAVNDDDYGYDDDDDAMDDDDYGYNDDNDDAMNDDDYGYYNDDDDAMDDDDYGYNDDNDDAMNDDDYGYYNDDDDASDDDDYGYYDDNDNASDDDDNYGDDHDDDSAGDDDDSNHHSDDHDHNNHNNDGDDAGHHNDDDHDKHKD